MSGKKGMVTAKKIPNTPQFRDMFETPSYAIKLLLPYIPLNIKNIWEPAAGYGKIVDVLQNSGYSVYPSDIRDCGGRNTVFNFLTDSPPFTFMEEDYAIITNPPFSLKDEFINRAVHYNVPFAFLVNADYHKKHSEWITKLGCQKLVPDFRISFITPNLLSRINVGEGTNYTELSQINGKVIKKYTSAQFHSMWLTRGFNLPNNETFVTMSLQERLDF